MHRVPRYDRIANIRNYNTIHTYLIDHSPKGLFRANETQSMKQQNTTTTTVKNPNWLEVNQLAIYKCAREVEPGTTRNKFNEWLEQVLNTRTPDLKASLQTTGPHCHSAIRTLRDKIRTRTKNRLSPKNVFSLHYCLYCTIIIIFCYYHYTKHDS